MPREIDVQQFAARLDAGEAFYLLDVRQPWEHEIAAFPGSRLIPLNQLAERATEAQPPEGCTVVVYCHHGMRSLRAAAFLEQNGLTDIASLAGGIDAWSLHIDPSMPRY